MNIQISFDSKLRIKIVTSRYGQVLLMVFYITKHIYPCLYVQFEIYRVKSLHNQDSQL